MSALKRNAPTSVCDSAFFKLEADSVDNLVRQMFRAALALITERLEELLAWIPQNRHVQPLTCEERA